MREYNTLLWDTAINLHVEPTYDEWLELCQGEIDGLSYPWAGTATQRSCIRESLVARAWGLT